MLGVFEHSIHTFSSFTKQKKINIILDSYDRDNEAMFYTNVRLQYAQQFVVNTKKFNHKS